MGSSRVLWLCKGLGRGGAEQLLVEALGHVDRSRFEVEVAYLLPWKDALVPALEERGVRVHCLGRSAHDLRWLPRLRRLVREGNFSIVHTHAPYPGVGARIVLDRRRALVHTEHNMWQRYHRLTAWTNAWTFGRNDEVIAVSRAVAGSIRRRPGRPPVEVVLHGIDPSSVRSGPEARARARATLGLDPHAHVLGTVGNFTRKKDQASLLTAMGALASRWQDLRLVLIGAGPLEAELRSQAETLGLVDRITFAGSRDDVLELLPAFDVFALSSQYEGLPIALVEAMATGLACVATRVGGVPEVISDGDTGFLVPPDDPGALAAAVEKLLEDDTVRTQLGRRARAAAAHFDMGAAMRQIELMYDRVLA